MRRQAVHAGNAKVEDLGDAGGGDDDILGLQIAMNDALIVRDSEGREHLAEDDGDAAIVERPLVVHHREEISTGEILHHDVQQTVVLAEVDDAHRARVIEPRRSHGLAMKARDERGLACHIVVKDLHRDVLLECNLLRAIDRTHRAAAEEVLDDELAAYSAAKQRVGFRHNLHADAERIAVIIQGVVSAERYEMSTVRIAVGVFAVALAAAVAIHHPAIRSALFRNGGGVGCPQLGSTSEVDEHRKAALAGLSGSTAAPEKKLFGVAVGRDGRASVRAWAEARELRCDNVPGDDDAMRCARTTKLLGVESDIFLRFHKDTLVALDAVATVPGSDAKAAYQSVENDVSSSYGPAHEKTELGELEKAGRVASVWRFRELAVDVSVFAVGDGPRLRLQVRALR